MIYYVLRIYHQLQLPTNQEHVVFRIHDHKIYVVKFTLQINYALTSNSSMITPSDEI